ncbi:MAG: beta-Ala-His dipeptidase [Clostridia bacterium]|nr:beta-Ala-His dipeptidase [Clostridia bacterium]
MLSNGFAYPGLMKYFEKISSIPRPSYHEEKIADYLCEFARERRLEFYRDELHNVFIKLPASAGRENEGAILLQGHTDMVCEKNSDVEHDFLNDGIKLYEKDGWIRAKGTTLGADNGVAVAAMLYILDGAEGNLPSHPAIECLFTVSEEVGMEGANGFDFNRVSAKKMINMDSADESQIISGCAGGVRSVMSYAPELEPLSDCATVSIEIRGLAGGHSGEDIHRGRANANKLMGRILLALSNELDVRLIKISGGSKDNAIPREAVASVATKQPEALIEKAQVLADTIRTELCHDDDGFTLVAKQTDCGAEKCATRVASDKLFFLLATVQNGVFEMNHLISGLVEYSRNLGVIETAESLEEIRMVFFARSSQNSYLDSSTEQLDAYAKQLSMTHTVTSRYPGWSYAEHSEIREKYSACYEKLYGKLPEILTIHAGLECGVIGEKIKGLDVISCGPVVLDLHSPDEALDKASFERFFTVIKNVLAL